MSVQTHMSSDQSFSSDNSEGRRLRVLLVDDDSFQRRVIGRMLGAQRAVDIFEAGDGEQALALVSAEASDFDLVLCDLDMPVMDGLAFIRHMGPTSRARLLLLSGCDTSLLGSAMAMCRAYGIEPLGALKKPVGADQLQALLEGLSNEAPAPEIRSAPAGSFGLEEILAAANNDEFEAYFQPKACLRSGRIVAAEALARWRHPRFGILPPYPHFIGQLESSGHIAGITEAMLVQAATACRAWQESGLNLSVSVNLSQRYLQDDVNLAERISEICEFVGLNPSRLILEVTETAAATDVGRVLESLTRLRMRGFELSIDDFGTGYSSLEQLSRVAFTELKIDRSFVSQITACADARTIVASSIDMAHRLGIRSVAEGIETAAEWDMLGDLGCDQVQGFLLGRAMPGNDFLDLALEQRR